MNPMMVSVGDRVRAWTSIWGRDYSTAGIVTERRWDALHQCYEVKIRDEQTGASDWFRAVNDRTHQFEVEVDVSEPMDYQSALRELRRQLKNGEATPEQYRAAISYAEGEMIAMHAAAQYDVLYYMQMEQTANVYREALGLPPSDVSARARVSPTLSDDEYRATMASRFSPPRQKPRRNGGGQLWEPCPRCGQEPVHLDCGYCDRHCRC